MSEDPRLRVLHVTPAYFPATLYGGPIFSTKALFDGLVSTGAIELRTLTTDACGPRPRDRVSVEANPLRFPAGYEVRYCRRIAMASVAPGLLVRLLGQIAWADLVHLTATYSFPTLPTLLIARLLRKPLVWSPRGGLQATAQWSGAPKRSGKMWFERICQAVRPSATVLHVTAALERDLSCARLPGIGTSIIPNIIDVPDDLLGRCWRPEGLLRLMFLSRLHPKKGIEVLLDAMVRLPEHCTLDIYGDGDPAYVAGLKAAAAPLGRRVRFHGHVEGEAKSRAFANADLFCLPTHSENFGIVVGEALAHGVPAVCTKGAPWDGLEIHRCGAWIDPGGDAFVRAVIDISLADLPAMGARGRAWIQAEFSRDRVVERTLELYRSLTGPGTGQRSGALVGEARHGA